MNKIIKNIIKVSSSLILLIGITILSILWGFSSDLPDYKFLKSYKPAVSSKVYSGDGELINDFSTEKRIFVPYKAIPKKVINRLRHPRDPVILSITGSQFSKKNCR